MQNKCFSFEPWNTYIIYVYCIGIYNIYIYIVYLHDEINYRLEMHCPRAIKNNALCIEIQALIIIYNV